MFENFGINVQFWVDRFKEGLDFVIGNNGVLKGPLIAFIAITVVGLVIEEIGKVVGILFGVKNPRLTQVTFAGAGSVWASSEEVNDLLEWGQYQKVGRRLDSSDYVALDSEGRELSRITVTRWLGD